MISWPVAVLTVVVAGLLAVSHVTTTVLLSACIVLAVLGPSGALQALTIGTLVSYGNPALIGFGPQDGVLVRALLVVAVLRILPLVRASDLRLLWPVLVFGVVSAATSAAASPAVAVSIMKIITFTLTVTAVLVAFRRIPPAQLRKLQSWFVTVGVTVIALSAATLAVPKIGLGLNGGLQGLLNQPQALGIFIAPFAAWSLAGVLMMRRQTSWLEIGIALGTLVLVFVTRARTGAVAVILGVGVVLVSRFLSRRLATQSKLGRPLLIVSVAAAVLVAGAFATGKVTETLTQFAYKDSDRNHDLTEAFYATRGVNLVSQWENFLSSPVIGHGFGVYPDGYFPSGVLMWNGIPLSAPVEKGFLPTAILEEGGLLGGALLAFLILWLSLEAWRNVDLRWRAMFVACLAMNVGECVFLAPGGIGMIDWLLLSLSILSYRAAPLMAAAPRPTLMRTRGRTTEPDEAGSLEWQPPPSSAV
jgi:O-antigen ligase